MLNPVDPAFETFLRGALPEAAFRPLDASYLEEPRGRFVGAGGLLVAPSSTEEVATVVRRAAERRIPVVPYGGGTGLVGGQIAKDLPAPVILSLERMTKIRAVHPLENALVVEAGAILATVQDAAEEAGRLFPLSLASGGSARIGGLLATNAGGVNVLRYGNARDLCLGIEAVLPSGEIFHGLKRLRKDNTGYDLRHLLVGSEGTLGVITAASLKLAPQPGRTGAALIAVSNPQAALRVLAMAQDQIGQGISAFELIHRRGLDFMDEVSMPMPRPFTEVPDWFVLVDLGLTSRENPNAALLALFETAASEGLAQDGVIAQSESQRQDFWTLRESIPEANRKIGAVSSHDISLPLGAIPDFVTRGAEVLAQIGDFRINCFGHLGDGNLHYNVFPQPGRSRADHEASRPSIKRAVHDLTHEMGGSVAAEHGVGRLKVEDLERYSDPSKLAAMRAIKAALDPAGIMNPGAVLRSG